MDQYQQRVITEKQELDGKTERLKAFIESAEFKTLSLEEQCLLSSQSECMAEYSRILGERIALWQ